MSTAESHRTLHVLVGVQSLVIVAVSVNRLGPWTGGSVAPNGFLRWVDLNNMALALVSLVAYHLLREHLRDGPDRALGVAFVVGAYLFAAGYGRRTSCARSSPTTTTPSRTCCSSPASRCSTWWSC